MEAKIDAAMTTVAKKTAARITSHTPEQVHSFRLKRHHLGDAKPADLVTICRDICGVQAQIMSAAYLQLWTRNHRITSAEVETALWDKRTLVKTSLMRQTVHLIPADEFALYVAAQKSARARGILSVMARLKISPEEADGLSNLILQVLEAGPRPHKVIAEAVRPKVSKRVRMWMELSSSMVRLPLAEGRICYGPSEGTQATFIKTDQWLGKQPEAGEMDAQCNLFRKYLAAYGPASVRDFCHWAGISIVAGKAIYDCMKDGLAPVTVGGTGLFLLRKDSKELAHSKQSHSVRLLPYFDPYLLAHAEKDHLLPRLHYKRVYRNQGWVSPSVLVNGKIVGVWSYKIQGKTLRVLIEPFTKQSRAMRAGIEAETNALAIFFDCTPVIEFGGRITAPPDD